VDVCPTECLVMTEKFDYSTAGIDGLHYSFARMTPQEIATAQAALEAEKQEAARAKAEAEAKAAQARAEAEAKPPAEPSASPEA
jgi:formate hydrogenlyase subunit 6/NADH:ubiquinone oxidoreductase subunit I